MFFCFDNGHHYRAVNTLNILFLTLLCSEIFFPGCDPVDSTVVSKHFHTRPSKAVIPNQKLSGVLWQQLIWQLVIEPIHLENNFDN